MNNNTFYKQNEAVNWNPNLTNTALNFLNLIPVSKDSTSPTTNGLDQFYMSELLQVNKMFPSKTHHFHPLLLLLLFYPDNFIQRW